MTGASSGEDRAATAAQPSPEEVSGKAGIPCAEGPDQTPQTARGWAELIADQFEITEVGAVDAIEEGVSRGRSEMASTAELLRGELKMAMLAFKRIEQEPRTPTGMRDIAGSRAHYIKELLDRVSA